MSNNVVCATSKGSHKPAHTRSLFRLFYEFEATDRTAFGVSKLKGGCINLICLLSKIGK